ncbi:MAG: hypothetical protein KA115_00510 [Candidatus Moranbacteria bacterium]|nr:hypothetical protein [Candidatus Moranbacteria bacterium]MBP7695664.1 hypothetical protein [Candidatus Moranbacteria bacterium]
MSKDVYRNGELVGKIDVTPTANGGTKTTESEVLSRDIFGFDTAKITTETYRDENNNVTRIDDRKK